MSETLNKNFPYTGALGAENSITVTAPVAGTCVVTVTRSGAAVQSATLTNGASLTFGPYNLDTQFRIVTSGSGNGVLTNQESLVTLINSALYTVATLPPGVKGARAMVTDATSPTFNATVAGSGAVTVPVFYNGTNWTVG